ncbi:MAG: right-handed parallel beta-helix repeat-containing protein [Candidatus Nomurabacteria bacterium]|nr:MAG: right-handed parallel beta-helix repeat-containing protein [Candidatus Nomurabacteria bacterium]
MPKEGIMIEGFSGTQTAGNDNLIEGVTVHNNGLSGIHVFSPYDEYPYGAFGSRNVIRNCTVYRNSDYTGDPTSGGNADGIKISSGDSNRVENCISYENSDDGIDAWRSTNTYFGYNISYGNGINNPGHDGNGIKAGGISAITNGTIVERNLIYNNLGYGGIIHNNGKDLTFINNTVWNNANYSIAHSKEVVSRNNIAVGQLGPSNPAVATNNSWQRSGTVEFISTNPSSPDFLRPTVGGGFEDIGVYAQ